MTNPELIKWSNGFGLLATQLMKDPRQVAATDLLDFSVLNAIVNALTVEDVQQASHARSLSSLVHPNAAGARIGVMEAIAASIAPSLITATSNQYSDAQYMSTAFTWDKGVGTYAINSSRFPNKYALLTSSDRNFVSEAREEATSIAAHPAETEVGTDPPVEGQHVLKQIDESVDRARRHLHLS